jgi:hypothetical protein
MGGGFWPGVMVGAGGTTIAWILGLAWLIGKGQRGSKRRRATPQGAAAGRAEDGTPRTDGGHDNGSAKP